MISRTLPKTAALFALAAIGCSGNSGPNSDDSAAADSGVSGAGCSSGEASVELGTGEDAFEPLQDGDPVSVINGPQGGQHILGSVRTSNMTSVATVRLSIQRAEDDSYVSDQTYRLQFFEDDAERCEWSYPGLFAYLGFVSLAQDNANFLWLDAIMRIEVTDNNGRTMSDEVMVIPELEPLATGDEDPPE
jgi:hypothetical protein